MKKDDKELIEKFFGIDRGRIRPFSEKDRAEDRDKEWKARK